MANKKFTIISGFQYGLGANLINFIQQLRVCEIEKRIPIIYWLGGLYMEPKGYNGVTKNIWEYYFHPVSNYSAEKLCKIEKVNYGVIKIKDEKEDIKVVRKISKEPNKECRECFSINVFPPKMGLYNPSDECRTYANTIIKKYFKIRDIVQDKINKFHEKNMQNKHILGIHIRWGRSMRPAQGHKPIERYIRFVKKYIIEYPETKVFVATNSAEALETMKSNFTKRIIHYNAFRSPNKWEFGIKQKKVGKCIKIGKKVAGGRIGEEALIDIVLLSQCDYLLYGASNMPAMALFWNPSLKNKFVCKYTEKYRKYLGIN